MTRTGITLLAIAALTMVACGNRDADNGAAPNVPVSQLRGGFNDPPQEARAQVWWHWMNGNITKEGLRKDLEWMHGIGIGGVHIFDAGTSVTPQIVEKRLVYMHDDWKDAFRYAVRLADSLGMEVTVPSSPGWSATGGPWVKPENAMKKIVWRTATVEGGTRVSLRLPEPFKVNGPFQDNPASSGMFTPSSETYYGDIAVMAVKVPDGQKDMLSLGARASSSAEAVDMAALTDDSMTSGCEIPADGKAGWLMYSFPESVTIKSVSLAVAGTANPFGNSVSTYPLECSDDGRVFTKVCDVPSGGDYGMTVSIPETTARHFRVVLEKAGPDNGGLLASYFGMGAPSIPKVTNFVLHPYTRVNRAEDKAAFTSEPHLADFPTPESEGESYASVSDVLDITSCMDADGNLNWDAPQGKWRVYRFGYSLTGKQNHPAPAEATGLEVDKLDYKAFGDYIRTYLDMYKDATGGMLGKGLQYLLTDSYEAGIENWTPSMREDFMQVAGYELTPWLPVLAGEVIGSPAESDAFLWDWRQAISGLISRNYAQITDILRNEYGMAGGYFESHEGGRPYVTDGMDVKKTASIPMGAMWSNMTGVGQDSSGVFSSPKYESDDRESSSVAHIYGQNIAAAESFTDAGNIFGSAYSYTPAKIKGVADLEMSCGINRFVIHESAHQPDDDHVPGLSLMGTGQWFNRHETWASMAKVWIDYLSRSSFMLQQGRNVADILFYYGEDSNVCSEVTDERPSGVPTGYQWDYCSPNALLDVIEVGGDSTLRSTVSGTTYSMLWMDRNVDRMSVKVLRKIAALAKGGAVIGGVRPKRPASMGDDAEEFNALVREIWDSGRENVHEGPDLKAALSSAGIAPDVKDVPDYFRFVHRDAGRSQVYWVNNPSNEAQTNYVSFRLTGLRPQVWHPDTGVIEDASYRVNNGRTEVCVMLEANDAVFVVFAGKGAEAFAVPIKTETNIAWVDGPWTVKFEENRGAPAQAEFSELKSYTESDDFGIKYFSGIATYVGTFTIKEKPGDGRTVIDLGEVLDMAEVSVNGKDCGITWKTPFRIDITDALKEGENTVEIRVANPWANRLIGDQQPDCPQKVAFTDMSYYSAQSPLRPAGLMGPVQVILKKTL